jgi:hypothetical protein
MILLEPANTITRFNVEIKRRTISLTGFRQVRSAHPRLTKFPISGLHGRLTAGKYFFHPRRACSRILRRPMFAKAVSRCGWEDIVRIDCPPHQPHLSVWACDDASTDRFTLG